MLSNEATECQTRKVAVIGGGSYGLGFSLAERLAADGYRVVLLARDEKKLEEAVNKLSKNDGIAFAIPCDVTDPQALENAVRLVEANEGHLDFLVANAGSVHVGLFEEHTSEISLADIKAGLSGTVLTVHAFLPLLRNGSKVLFIASGFGLMGAAGYAPYCAANAGIINFAEALRREWLRRNISVYVACPSDIETPGYRREIESLPPWMDQAEVRGKALQPADAANRILSQCRGKRFLILINPELRLLQAAKRLLPERALLFLVDRLFPKPPPAKPISPDKE